MLEVLGIIDCLIYGTVRIIADPFDRRRIRRFFKFRGSHVWSVEWSPLSSGWIRYWHDRFYDVTYEDGGGKRQAAKCRTNWGRVQIIDESRPCEHSPD